MNGAFYLNKNMDYLFQFRKKVILDARVEPGARL